MAAHDWICAGETERTFWAARSRKEAQHDQVKTNLPDFRYEGIAFYTHDDDASFVI
ncbi:hypothetical protein [Methylobacterium sp. R2-1]|uniref:hypothetical protein n=1 Tax=Methylobacterium sp. R2-1 TaxID=2587064 RepID=UPI00161CCD50|nr:hypothetical protein [Methylobacterium sp. R2-1]MBB2961140.1 hypothetical protein [Methylobacterium sp. R2-1]